MIEAPGFHPAAGLFPLMDGIGIRALADDIKAHGLVEPIVLLDGLVLDGRNRLRACELAGVVPRYVAWTEDEMTPVEWVVSMNLHRRHLTTAQRAALALDLLPRLEEEARERQVASLKQGGLVPVSPESDERGRADEKAAELVGVGRSTVAAVKAIQKRDETGEVIDAMRAGSLNVAQAAREVGFVGLSQGSGFPIETDKRDARGANLPTYFGKGDKWTEASVPLVRYLAAFQKRDWHFGHVNPREASKRVTVIDGLIESLTAARADLVMRSHKAKAIR